MQPRRCTRAGDNYSSSALAVKLSQAGLGFLGDGAMNNGAFHEAANLAGLWGHDGLAPVVFIVENNQYGMGTPVPRASAVPNLASRFAAHDIPNWMCDGMDAVAVFEVARHNARRGAFGISDVENGDAANKAFGFLAVALGGKDGE